MVIVEIEGTRFECATPLEAVRVYREHVSRAANAWRTDPEKVRRRNQQAREYYRRRKAKG
jgi:hypothetical protein